MRTKIPEVDIAHWAVASSGQGLLKQSGGGAFVRIQMAQRLAAELNGLGNLPSQEDQIDADVFSDSMREDEGGGDGAAEDVQAAGGAGNVFQGEIGRGGGLVADDDEVAHDFKDELEIQASFGLQRNLYLEAQKGW